MNFPAPWSCTCESTCHWQQTGWEIKNLKKLRMALHNDLQKINSLLPWCCLSDFGRMAGWKQQGRDDHWASFLGNTFCSTLALVRHIHTQKVIWTQFVWCTVLQWLQNCPRQKIHHWQKFAHTKLSWLIALDFFICSDTFQLPSILWVSPNEIVWWWVIRLFEFQQRWHFCIHSVKFSEIRCLGKCHNPILQTKQKHVTDLPDTPNPNQTKEERCLTFWFHCHSLAWFFGIPECLCDWWKFFHFAICFSGATHPLSFSPWFCTAKFKWICSQPKQQRQESTARKTKWKTGNKSQQSESLSQPVVVTLCEKIQVTKHHSDVHCSQGWEEKVDITWMNVSNWGNGQQSIITSGWLTRFHQWWWSNALSLQFDSKHWMA